MKRQWFAAAWALLGAPAAIVLVGCLEIALFRNFPKSIGFLEIGALLPGVCIGLGMIALLSLVKTAWSRVICASVYGVAMYALAETAANPVLWTHAALVSLPR